MRVSDCRKNKEITFFPKLIGDFTGFDQELTKGIVNDQIIMAVLQENQLFFISSFSRLTKNNQYIHK